MDGGMAQNGKSAGSEKLNSQALHPPTAGLLSKNPLPPSPPQKKIQEDQFMVKFYQKLLEWSVYFVFSVRCQAVCLLFF